MADQKLSLDMTPLIDIVFLLVLFFAVSTSFISGEDLKTLKDNVLNLGQEVDQLERDKIAEQQRANSAAVKLEQALDARERELAQRQNDLSSALARETSAIDAHSQLQKVQNLLQMELEDLNRNQASLQQQLTNESREKTRLLAERDEARNRRLSASQQIAALNASADVLTLQNTRAQATVEIMQRELRGVQSQLAQLQFEREDLRSQLDAQTSRAQALTIQAKLRRRESQEAGEALQLDNNRLRSELEKFREIAALDQQQIQRIMRAQKQISEGLGDYLADNKLGIKRDRQQLILQLSDQILFASGKAVLKPQGLEVLRDLGKMLSARMGDLQVQIGGHTDNIPVAGVSGPLSDNWGLSAARAVNVVRFFQDQLGVDAERLSAVGYGEHHPVGDNATGSGRAKNRRIEIVLLPR